MSKKRLIVKVKPECEDLANQTFPRGTEWEFLDEEYKDDGSGTITYEWNGDMQSAIEQNLNTNNQVTSYKIKKA